MVILYNNTCKGNEPSPLPRVGSPPFARERRFNMNKKQRLDYLQEQLLEASYLVFDGFINDYDDYKEYSRVENLFFDTIYYDWR